MLFSHMENMASARIPDGTVTQVSWSGPPGVDVDPTDAYLAGLKRQSSEALYHQAVLGAYNAIGQSEAWFTTNLLAKRPRFDSTSNLPIYPQRPGEKDCAHYMLTRTCKFGESCKFDHPFWVPEGGIPDWKEVPLVPSEALPERPGELDCPYFLKTQRCKFGLRCKFNHPKDFIAQLGAETVDVCSLPERPSEPLCAFYMKTGKCSFGATCRFNHPRDIQMAIHGQENGRSGPISDDLEKALFTPASMHNTKGLPIRLGEADCPFYLKTGSCKYGATCRYNHPDRYAINPPAAVLGTGIVASPAAHLSTSVFNPTASILQTIDPRLTQTALGLAPTMYPQRPGQVECDYYMKTGECKFGERCKYHHPMDRSASLLMARDDIKLTLAGLPRREGAIHCPFYMKTGTCKYGSTCKFDHPPPGEVMSSSAYQGSDEQNDEQDAMHTFNG